MAKSAVRATSTPPGVFSQTISLPTNNPDPNDPSAEEKLSFWERVSSIPDEQWATNGEKGYKIYLYDDDAKGSKYIAVITEPIDIEWVRVHYGGGTYLARFNDSQGRAVCSLRFVIDGEPRRKPVQNAQNGPPPAPVVDSFQAQVLTIIQEGQRRQEQFLERLIDRLHDRGPAPVAQPAVDPMAIIGPTLQGVVGIFTSLIPKSGNALDDMLKLKELMGQPRDLFSELAKFKELGLIGGTATAGGVGSLMEQIEVVMQVADKLGLTGGGKRSIFEVIAEKTPDVLKMIKEGVAEYRGLEEKRLETAKTIATLQQQQIAQQPRPSSQPAALPVSPTPAPTVQPGPAAPHPTQLQVEPIATNGSPAAQAAAEMTEQQINAIKAEIVNFIRANVEGADLFGYLRLKWPEVLNGMCIFDDTTHKATGVIPIEMLDAFCMSDPILSQAAQFPRYRAILTELLEEVKHVVLGEGPDGEI